MFIHEMSESECRLALAEANVGRLACARDDQPYVVPVHFVFDGTCLYGFTTFGQKIEWMRSNPLVCFEIDELDNGNHWVTVVVFGRYEELTELPKYESARLAAHKLLEKLAMWWEPAYIAQTSRDYPHSLTPIFYRIHIDKMTGRRAIPETGDGAEVDEARKERGWLDKLLHPFA